jgi:UDP-N-acetylmuramate dehydrogenase
MQIQKNISLKPYNTFGIAVRAKNFCQVNSTDELREALRLEGYPEKFVLGGGSNVLLTKDVDALVLHVNIKGREIIEKRGEKLHLKVMAGENWHETVMWCVDQGFGGLENLSLIPGNTGSAPLQNIGAYGVELKDVLVSCEALELATMKIKQFSNAECAFGYRDSYFKNKGKGRFIITSIVMELSTEHHRINTAYGSIEAELALKNIVRPTIKDVSEAVIAIRQAKLPDPKILGNSGSFFKNPVIDGGAFAIFIAAHPEAPFYKISENSYKIPAGWLIEQCGFKGKRFGDAGVHQKQALVLVNHGHATGMEILDLAHRIMEAVDQKYGIEISPEVNII